MPSRPLVALTAGTGVLNGVPRVQTNEAYVRAAESVGLLPLVLPPLTDPSAAGRALDAVDALILTGGEDVAPSWYDAVPHRRLERTNPRRDALEIALVRDARARGLPTLALCRGLQVVNVALGGTLVQDLDSERPGPVHHADRQRRADRVHPVRLERGSRMSRAIGTLEARVNSMHHQAVERLAPTLRATGWAADGVIEALESADGWELLAVQWHPEELLATPEDWDRTLFASFARLVGETATARPARRG